MENKPENEVVAFKDKALEEFDDPIVECRHCGNHPCFGIEMEPFLITIVDTYSDCKTNKQLRFMMYSAATKHIHGPGLGKGVRKKLPNCVSDLIRSMSPSDIYTGYIESNDDKK